MGGTDGTRSGKLGQAIALEDAEELAWGGSTDAYEFVANEDLGNSRWESNHLIVFRDKESDELLCFDFSSGLTEYQDEVSYNGESFEYSEGPHSVQVKPATFETKVVRVYREVEAE